jgi:TPR repeat protein
MLGWMYEVGRGVPKNLGESLRWYRLAADRGNADARARMKFLERSRRESIPSAQIRNPPK